MSYNTSINPALLNYIPCASTHPISIPLHGPLATNIPFVYLYGIESLLSYAGIIIISYAVPNDLYPSTYKNDLLKL